MPRVLTTPCYPQPSSVVPSVIVSAANPETSRGTASTLADQDPDLSIQISRPEQLFRSRVDPKTIIVIECNVDLASPMATLRRLCRELGETRVVVLSPPATGTGVRRALDAGAAAVVFDSQLHTALPATLIAVAAGQSVVPHVSRASLERPTLSHRERQVLVRVSRGFTNSEIAKQLFLAESTVKSHLSSAFRKFGVRSRTEAATLFLEFEARDPSLNTPAIRPSLDTYASNTA